MTVSEVALYTHRHRDLVLLQSIHPDLKSYLFICLLLVPQLKIQGPGEPRLG